MGEGEGREDADKIKGMKWKVFSRAFLGGGFEATTTNTVGQAGSGGWWPGVVVAVALQERVSSLPGVGPLIEV